MKKEIAEAWVKDLRTNPRQAFGVLHDGEGHCCLGRLCLIVGAVFEKSERYDGETVYYPVLNGRNLEKASTLPREVMKLSGLKYCAGDVVLGAEDSKVFSTILAEENDIGKNFSEIADIIEKHWESL